MDTKEGQAARVLPCGDEAVRAATGRTWDEWCAYLDAAGAAARTHREIVALVVPEISGNDGWWGQMVTVGYERLRGLRAKHQTAAGFNASVSKTLDAPAAEAFDALAGDERRERWLPDAFHVTKATPHRIVRAKAGDGTAVVFSLIAKGERCSVTVEAQKLADAEAVAAAKTRWRAVLEALAAEVAR
jgi:hypothetical protein